MELRKIIRTTIREYLNEQQILKENNDRFILLPYDDYNEDYEDYGIDEYEASDKALQIAKDGGVTILRDKRLSGILIDSETSKVIGAIWVSDSSDSFSFDIAIDSPYQNMGLSDILIKDGINEYRIQKDMYDDIGKDFKMEVDVINPKLVKILKNKYGFHVVGKISQDRVLMSID